MKEVMVVYIVFYNKVTLCDNQLVIVTNTTLCIDDLLLFCCTLYYFKVADVPTTWLHSS